MKYTSFYFLFFFGIVSAISVAQNDKAYVEELVSEFTKSLESRAIDDYFYRYKYCNGTIEMFTLEEGKMCVSKGTYYEVYVFWKERNQPMIKKIDNCGLYFSLPLWNSKILEFVELMRQPLGKRVVKKYEVENPENVPVQSSKVHPCFRSFQFKNENNSFGQTYNLYDLTNESKYENLNFEYNNDLEIIALEKVIESTLSEMESKFRRQF